MPLNGSGTPNGAIFTVIPATPRQKLASMVNS